MRVKPAPNQRHTHCQRHIESPEHEMFLRNSWNKSVLAQNMLSTDAALRDAAAQDIKKIQHANNGLWQRAGGLETLSTLVAEGVKIYAVTIADGFDFDVQIEAAFYDIAQNMKEADDWPTIWPSAKAKVNQALKFLGRITFSNQAAVNSNATKLCSKIKNKNNKAGGCHSSRSKMFLSDEEREAIAQYYEGDYDIIERLRDVGCHGKLADTCRGALASILADRPAVKDERLPSIERLPNSAAYMFKGGRWLGIFFAGVKGPARCAKLIQTEPSCNQEWFSHRTNTNGDCQCASREMRDGREQSNWVNTQGAKAEIGHPNNYTDNGNSNGEDPVYLQRGRRSQSQQNGIDASAGLYRIVEMHTGTEDT